ncbi:SIS domain-containing protein [Candidatus Pelagibacter giovannonii]|uniref:SIS domain-containing protein n=1 Tax=Candidatus Pelagibacter giovannonii TaxID=2563896 RepID=A0A6H1Q200_9PROT|nr:SIS domain-containing protein [Candidatus Pelagibacter giovannonii]QIZ20854.1 SIS domain-containing protein [Candidatus Pelagibacter giovannonii]|tara:strand:+ start:209 stop:817 length:609 start_codon:yes stop_codon:yes gene_type:complete
MKTKPKKQNFFLNTFINSSIKTINLIDQVKISKIASEIKKIKDRNGRIFFIGSGGSAGNASHAVNDFRKLCNIECYSPSDNTSELTARINDDGWDTSYSNWLKVSKLNSKDGVFVFSVGGGSIKKKVSMNIVNVLKLAKRKKAKIFGVVSRDGGYTKKVGDVVIVLKIDEPNFVTPISESLQVLVWHCLVTDKKLQVNKTKW